MNSIGARRSPEDVCSAVTVGARSVHGRHTEISKPASPCSRDELAQLSFLECCGASYSKKGSTSGRRNGAPRASIREVGADATGRTRAVSSSALCAVARCRVCRRAVRFCCPIASAPRSWRSKCRFPELQHPCDADSCWYSSEGCKPVPIPLVLFHLSQNHHARIHQAAVITIIEVLRHKVTCN